MHIYIQVMREEMKHLRKIRWRYMVVDEAHRLKNRDSATAADVHSLRVEHMHLLTGTPVQNNMTELWALLNLLDKKRFPAQASRK